MCDHGKVDAVKGYQNYADGPQESVESTQVLSLNYVEERVLGVFDVDEETHGD